MSDVNAVAQWMLETHGTLDGVKAATNDPAVIAAAQRILDGKKALEMPKRFIEIIQAQDLTEVEKGTIGQFCQKYGTDSPTVFRLYKVFKALNS